MNQPAVQNAARVGALARLARAASSKWLALAFRLYLAGLFIYASVHKIVYVAQFAETVAGYEIVPWFAINAVAVFMPWLELVTGLFLLAGFRTRASAAIVFGLLGVFTLAILVNLLRGASISCGCFHTSDAPMTWMTLARDLAWMAMAAHVYAFDRMFQADRRFTLAPTRMPDPAGNAPNVASLLLTGALLSAVMTLGLSGCSDSDQKTAETAGSVVGYWTGSDREGGEIVLALEAAGGATLSTVDDAAKFRWSRRRAFGKTTREDGSDGARGDVVTLHAPTGGTIVLKVTPDGLALPLPGGGFSLLKRKPGSP